MLKKIFLVLTTGFLVSAFIPTVSVGQSITTSRNFNDTALSGGGGAGVKIKVFENVQPGQNQQTYFLDIRAKCLLGGEAEYLREGSLRNNNENLELDT